MTVAPVPESRGAGRSRSHLGRWVVRLSVISGLAFAAGLGAVVIAYAIGEEAAVEDTTLALVLATIAIAGFIGAAVAFVIAIVLVVVADAKQLLREGPLVGWLPLGIFPAIVLIVVLGEVFWWE